MAESAEITALRTQIAEAKAALHKIMCGDKEVRIGFGENRQTQWNEPKPEYLRAYIADLELQLAGLLGTVGRGPIYPVGISR